MPAAPRPHVGVMPPEFQYPNADIQPWQPLWFGSAQRQDERARGRDSLVVIGRLAAGATIESARAELDTIAARLPEQYPASNASRPSSLVRGHDS